MNDVVNFRKARKDRDRAVRKAEADANAARHGQTKAERLAQAARETKARAHLDAHKFEDE